MIKKFFSSDDSEVNSKVATIFIVLLLIAIMIFASITTSVIPSVTAFALDPHVLWVLAGIIIGALGADGLSMLGKK
jgi:uncharacterized membrane-anchored protein